MLGLMVIVALVVLAVAAVLSRGSRHPRLLRGALAFALTLLVMYAGLMLSPRATMTTAQAYGFPLMVALVVGLVP